MRHKHRHKRKHKHQTSRVRLGRTKANSMENSFFFVFEFLRVSLMLCFLAYACVARENQALINLKHKFNSLCELKGIVIVREMGIVKLQG